MKAAVMYRQGDLPQYADFPDPVVQNEHERLIFVKAAAVKHLDKARASGRHYSAGHDGGQAQVIGGDGVGMLEDGRRVYAMGPGGMMAEQALADRSRMVYLPEGIDDAVAAALPNAVLGSAMGLRFKAGIKPGETVLINGATGFTGKMAVQIARHYGAGTIIATGRNERTLRSLPDLGATETIAVDQEEEAFIARLKEIHRQTPIDVVLDYLWGYSAGCILAALKGDGNFGHRTRFVSVGAVTGDILPLSSQILRGTDLRLYGSGLGSWTREEVGLFFSEILPEAFALAAKGGLKVDTVSLPLKDIAQLWHMEIPDGKRLVLHP